MPAGEEERVGIAKQYLVASTRYLCDMHVITIVRSKQKGGGRSLKLRNIHRQ